MTKQRPETRQQYMGHAIKSTRKQYDFSQEVFAEKLAISQHAISELETGKRFPEANTFIRFMKYYDGKPEELFAVLNAYLDEEDENIQGR